MWVATWVIDAPADRRRWAMLGLYGAFAILNNDRTTAESLFRTSMQKKPREFWHWVNAGGSYLGVKPQ